jgi:hypothetical protein
VLGDQKEIDVAVAQVIVAVVTFCAVACFDLVRLPLSARIKIALALLGAAVACSGILQWRTADGIYFGLGLGIGWLGLQWQLDASSDRAWRARNGLTPLHRTRRFYGTGNVVWILVYRWRMRTDPNSQLLLRKRPGPDHDPI